MSNKEPTRTLKSDVDNRHYGNVHDWLRRNFGKANKCEHDTCRRSPVRYTWALKHGCEYEKNRDNFIMLCASCHRKYDCDECLRDRLKRTGKPFEKGKHNAINMTGNRFGCKPHITIKDGITTRFGSIKELSESLGCDPNLMSKFLKRTTTHIYNGVVVYKESDYLKINTPL